MKLIMGSWWIYKYGIHVIIILLYLFCVNFQQRRFYNNGSMQNMFVEPFFFIAKLHMDWFREHIKPLYKNHFCWETRDTYSCRVYWQSFGVASSMAGRNVRDTIRAAHRTKYIFITTALGITCSIDLAGKRGKKYFVNTSYGSMIKFVGIRTKKKKKKKKTLCSAYDPLQFRPSELNIILSNEYSKPCVLNIIKIKIIKHIYLKVVK